MRWGNTATKTRRASVTGKLPSASDETYWRLDVAVGATVSYSLRVQERSATHSLLLVGVGGAASYSLLPQARIVSQRRSALLEQLRVSYSFAPQD